MLNNVDDTFHFHLESQHGFKYRVISSSETFELQPNQINTLTHNAIFFQLEGSLVVSWGEHKDVLIEPGQLYFLPRGAAVKGRIIECEGKFEIKYVAARLDHDLSNTSAFTELLEYSEQKWHDSYIFKPLPIREPMNLFVESVKRYILDGVKNNQLQNMKFVELFHLFSRYYSKEERVNLFHPVLVRNSKFKTFILDNYNVSVTIEELAQKANMSRSTFDRNFKENFGTTPHKWFEIQTRIIIMRKAAEPDVTVKDMMYEVGICNASQFTQLCKRLCGMAPSQLIRH